MRIRMSSIAMVAAVGAAVLGSALPARADIVTYSTLGTFTGGDAAGTSVYLDAANGIQITFAGIISQSVNASPTSVASFGTFDSTGTTAASEVGTSSGFTLDIVQTSPSPGGAITFVGALSGTLSFDSGGAHIQFSSPLSQSIGNILYAITEADNSTPGRANIVPPSVNSGISSVEGQITTSIPEPSSLMLAGLASPVFLLMLRKKMGKATA